MTNKAFFLVLTFSILFHHFAQAQYQIGISTGMTKAWENYGSVETPEDAELHIYGKYLKLEAYQNLKNNFHIGLEPSITQKGARCVPGFEDFNSDSYLFLNYVDLPLLIKYDNGIFNDRISIHGKLGYGASFLRKAYFATSTDSDVSMKDLNLREISLGKPFSEVGSFARFEHSIFSGVALGINLGQNQIVLEGDYLIGLSNATRFNTSQNRTLEWGIGYSYRF